VQAAANLNIDIKLNRNIISLPEEAIKSSRLTDKLNLFNVSLQKLILNNKLINCQELSKMVPGLTPSEYSHIVKDVRSIKANVNKPHKGKHPFKFFPLPVNYQQCEYWDNNTIPIWTDGSAYQTSPNSTIKTGWGIFFKTNSGNNISLRTNLEQDITSAELTAIEYALSLAPLADNIVIFTDSLNSVKLLEQAPSWNIKDWNKCLYA
jgi:hypothetical protein